MKKVLGVLGGMGPMATVDFFEKVVNLTKANADSEHIHILIDNYPQIPDRQGHIVYGKEDPTPYMIKAVKNLLAQGADLIAMPCNTAHYFAPAIKEATGCEFVHILDVNAHAGKERFGTDKKVGILATSGVLKSGIYEKAFSNYGIECVNTTEAEQKTIVDLIYGIKGGKYPETDKEIREVLDNMKSRGADYFVLGCTELPLLAQHLCLDKSYDLLDTTYEQAKAAVVACGYELNI